MHILKQKYESMLGQLIDLKQGNLGEIVLRNNEWADMLRELLVDKIKDMEKTLNQDEEITNAQQMKDAEIIRNYNDGASADEIALSLEEPLSYVKDVIDRQEAKIDIKKDVEEQVKTDWVDENKPDPILN